MDPEAATPSYLPWDTSAGNRFAPYSPTNHSAPLWIAALLSLIYVVCVLVTRIFIKRRVFGWDDTLITASTCVALCAYISIFVALRDGLGRTPETVPDLRPVSKLVFGSRILLLLSMYLAKLSSIFLLRRLFARDQKSVKLLCNLSLGFTIMGGLVSVLVSSVGCPSSAFFAGHCHGQVTRWSIVTALDVSSEVLSLILPPYMVWQLQMKVTYKLRVVGAFCFRVFVIVFSVLHLDAWIHYTKGPPSPFLIVPSLIWQQTLLAWSVISATIPNLKAFLQSLSANWGGVDWGYTTKAYGNGTFELKNMNSGRHGKSATESNGPFPGATGSKEHHNGGKTRGESASLGSGGSQDLIIRKETAWTVERS